MIMFFVQWHGGHSYAPPTASDTEEVASLQVALDLCRSRYENTDGSTPAVDESSGMAVFVEDPRETGDEYPDRLIVRSDRGRWMVTGT